MKRLALLLGATGLIGSPVVAQMNMPGMHMPGMGMSHSKQESSAKKKTTKKVGGAKTPLRRSAKPASKKAAPDIHRVASPMSGMDMHGDDAMKSMPGMDMSHEHKVPETQAPPAESMQDMPGMVMPHEGHGGHHMEAMKTPAPPLAPPPPQALEGPENAADAVYGQHAMQASRSFLMQREHGGMTASKLLVREFETRFGRGPDGFYLNAEAWHGGDIDKLWLRTEVEGYYGRKPKRAEFQALWSHAVDPWWDIQAGVRLDATPSTRGRLAVGVQGLAPYWIETEATAFVSTEGDVTARLDAEHDVRITQKLIFQPRTELNLSLQDIPSERTSRGLSSVQLGLRLRYAFAPTFAPYVGLVYDRAVGTSARRLSADGEEPGMVQFTVGLRTWF